MPLDTTAYNAIFNKLVVVANEQVVLIEATFRALSPNENPTLIDKLERIYKELADILKNPDSDLEGTVNRLNTSLQNHFSATKAYYLDEVKDTKKSQYFEENPPCDYEKLLQECLKKGAELRHVLEHGKTLNDFKKIPDIDLKPSPFLVKTYRRLHKNEDDFYKAVAQATSDSESNFEAVYDLLTTPRTKADSKLLNDVLNRIKYALYEQFKANPDLLSVRD